MEQAESVGGGIRLQSAWLVRGGSIVPQALLLLSPYTNLGLALSSSCAPATGHSEVKMMDATAWRVTTASNNLRHGLRPTPCHWARREAVNLHTQVSAPSATSRRICHCH
jgi:hypothetical protein